MTKARDNYGKALAFIEQALLHDTDECILWPFTHKRYPTVGHGRRVNRVICERAYGPPPFVGAEAAHSCAVRLCINKRHLRWATRLENAADSVAHGTQVKGERIHTAKLTEDDVRTIRTSDEHYLVVCERFGISNRHYYGIRKRESWGHVQ